MENYPIDTGLNAIIAILILNIGNLLCGVIDDKLMLPFNHQCGSSEGVSLCSLVKVLNIVNHKAIPYILCECV